MNAMTGLAMEILSERSCSVEELKKNLKEVFNHETDLETKIEFTIQQLQELHLINDRRLADNLTQRYAHKGNCFITKLLQHKGISDEVIADALLGLGDEYSRAMELLKQRNQDVNNTFKNKLNMKRFLLGRGFSIMTIRAISRQFGVGLR